MQVQSLGQKDPLEKEMATHSSVLAWRIPWTEEPGRLQSTGSDTTEALSKHTCISRGRVALGPAGRARLVGEFLECSLCCKEGSSISVCPSKMQAPLQQTPHPAASPPMAIQCDSQD